jgi:aspartyl-tRNA(Asn)/glutamyl-tRNA(Gln) amidotransferase subunit B
MEEGSFRCDANVSLKKIGEERLGTRREIKNLNSFKHIEKAINYEVYRQAAVLDAGEDIVQATLLWDAAKNKTRQMRLKGDGEDYRYFCDPDLPALYIDASRISAVKLEELLPKKAKRYRDSLGINQELVTILTSDSRLASFFEDVLKASNGLEPKQIAGWVCGEWLAAFRRKHWSWERLGVGSGEFAELLSLMHKDKLAGKQIKLLFHEMVEEGLALADLLKKKLKKDMLSPITSEEEIRSFILLVMENHPQLVDEYQQGKKQVLGFFMGEVMRLAEGRIDPRKVQEALKGVLE